MKKLVSLLLAGIMCFTLAACGSGQTEQEGTETQTEQTTVDKIKEAGKIVVGTSADYPPYEYHTMINGEDKIVGFDIDLANAIAEKLGVEVEIQDMAFEGLLVSLAEGKFDMVMAGLTIDPERKVLFSNSYVDRDQAVIVKKDNADQYKTTADLDGKKVGAQKGTVQEELAQTVAATNPVSLVKFTDLITEVKNGTIDAVIADSDVATGYVAANDDLVISDIKIDYENSSVGIAFKEDNQALCDEVNKIIAEMQEDGTMDKLFEEAMAASVEATSAE